MSAAVNPQHSIGTLSRGERKVFDLLAEGHTRLEVAAMLGNSPNTINTHVSRGARKLKARNPGHAVILYVRRQAEEETG